MIKAAAHSETRYETAARKKRSKMMVNNARDGSTILLFNNPLVESPLQATLALLAHGSSHRLQKATLITGVEVQRRQTTWPPNLD